MEQCTNQNVNRQPRFRKVIGNTTYVVRVYYSETAKETLENKIMRMLREDVSDQS